MKYIAHIQHANPPPLGGRDLKTNAERLPSAYLGPAKLDLGRDREDRREHDAERVGETDAPDLELALLLRALGVHRSRVGSLLVHAEEHVHAAGC